MAQLQAHPHGVYHPRAILCPAPQSRWAKSSRSGGNLSHHLSVPWVTTSSHAPGEPRTGGGGVCENICPIVHGTSSEPLESPLDQENIDYNTHYVASSFFATEQWPKHTVSAEGAGIPGKMIPAPSLPLLIALTLPAPSLRFWGYPTLFNEGFSFPSCFQHSLTREGNIFELYFLSFVLF